LGTRQEHKKFGNLEKKKLEREEEFKRGLSSTLGVTKELLAIIP
jgi:hypothetical protein